jgi:hypothetical protein
MSLSGLEKELDKGFFDEEAAQHNTPIIIIRTKAKATGSKNNNIIQKTTAAPTSITDLPLSFMMLLGTLS